MTDFIKRVRCEQDGVLRDFCKGITLLVIGIAKSRKTTSIAMYIKLFYQSQVVTWPFTITGVAINIATPD